MLGQEVTVILKPGVLINRGDVPFVTFQYFNPYTSQMEREHNLLSEGFSYSWKPKLSFSTEIIVSIFYGRTDPYTVHLYMTPTEKLRVTINSKINLEPGAGLMSFANKYTISGDGATANLYYAHHRFRNGHAEFNPYLISYEIKNDQEGDYKIHVLNHYDSIYKSIITYINKHYSSEPEMARMLKDWTSYHTYKEVTAALSSGHQDKRLNDTEIRVLVKKYLQPKYSNVKGKEFFEQSDYAVNTLVKYWSHGVSPSDINFDKARLRGQVQVNEKYRKAFEKDTEVLRQTNRQESLFYLKDLIKKDSSIYELTQWDEYYNMALLEKQSKDSLFFYVLDTASFFSDEVRLAAAVRQLNSDYLYWETPFKSHPTQTTLLRFKEQFGPLNPSYVDNVVKSFSHDYEDFSTIKSYPNRFGVVAMLADDTDLQQVLKDHRGYTTVLLFPQAFNFRWFDKETMVALENEIVKRYGGKVHVLKIFPNTSSVTTSGDFKEKRSDLISVLYANNALTNSYVGNSISNSDYSLVWQGNFAGGLQIVDRNGLLLPVINPFWGNKPPEDIIEKNEKTKDKRNEVLLEDELKTQSTQYGRNRQPNKNLWVDKEHFLQILDEVEKGEFKHIIQTKDWLQNLNDTYYIYDDNDTLTLLGKFEPYKIRAKGKWIFNETKTTVTISDNRGNTEFYRVEALPKENRLVLTSEAGNVSYTISAGGPTIFGLLKE